jgi:hypothetical protein
MSLYIYIYMFIHIRIPRIIHVHTERGASQEMIGCAGCRPPAGASMYTYVPTDKTNICIYTLMVEHTYMVMYIRTQLHIQRIIYGYTKRRAARGPIRCAAYRPPASAYMYT